MNKFKQIASILIVGAAITSCTSNSNNSSNNVVLDGTENVASNNATGVEIIYKDGLTLTEVVNTVENATLKLIQPDITKSVSEGAVNFNYEVTGVTVGENASINFSLNNALVKSYSSNNFKRNLPEGDFVFASFLVDDEGKSIKSSSANVVSPIKIGSYSDEEVTFNKDSAHIIYNKPQGVYKGEAAKKVLLDFVLLNTELSKKGNRVKVLINGTEFILDSWKSYHIEGMPMGENVIKIDLVNDLGVVPGPFNRGEERVITLVAEAS